MNAAFLLAGTIAVAPAHADDFLFATTTEYEISGSTARIELDTPWSPQTDVEPIGSDAVVRNDGRYLYVVNRLGADNLQVIDPGAGFQTVAEFSLGAGSNPQDAVVVSPNEAFVSRYESTQLYVVDPLAQTILDSIDLALFGDADGLPEAARMIRVGGRIFVALQRLDRTNSWTPTFPSMVAVIDIATRTLVDADPLAPGVQAIALTATNPWSELSWDEAGARILVPLVGAYGANDGGVEAIDPITLQTQGLLVSESQLGAEVGPALAVGDDLFVVTSTNFFFDSQFIAFDLVGGVVTDTLHGSLGLVPDIIHDPPTDRIFLADRKNADPGVRVFDVSAKTEITSSPIDTGLPPYDLTLFRASYVGVPNGGEESADADDAQEGAIEVPALMAWPNPSRGEVVIRMSGASGAVGSHGSVSIYDLSGRLVRSLPVQTRSAGELIWDGADSRGRSVPPGIYMIRADQAGSESNDSRAIRVIRLR